MHAFPTTPLVVSNQLSQAVFLLATVPADQSWPRYLEAARVGENEANLPAVARLLRSLKDPAFMSVINSLHTPVGLILTQNKIQNPTQRFKG